MKIRIFENMDDSVFRVVMNTEDFSQEDMRLMCQFGEPEVNVGGDVTYEIGGETKTKAFGDQYVRLLHGFPYAFGFDSRDFETDGIDEAIAAGTQWKETVKGRIREALQALRAKSKVLPAEEVTNI